MSRPPLPHSYWVLAGEFLAGEYPLELRLPGDRSKRIERLLNVGIDCFINLTAPGECPEYAGLLPEGVVHIRRPLEDHGLPADPGQMQEIQATIAAQLAAGRRLYVHCRAGIGRTGTVVGCYLVEQGHGGREALAELNRLWAQNSLARSWPEVPETQDQKQYVHDWQQYRSAPTLALAATPPPVREQDQELRLVGSLRERFQGAMLGLAVGDALAAATQFRRRGSFTPVGDVLGGGPYDLPRGGWSDDTAMALCLAESLAERHTLDSNDLLARLLRWQSEGHLSATGQCVGITVATARALARSQWRRGAMGGSHDPKQREPEALSHVAPAVLHAFADEATAVALVADTARMTCQSPVVIDSCRLLAAMLHAALRGEPRARILRLHSTAFATRPLKRDVALVAVAPPAAEFDARDPVGADALDALQAARWAFATTGNFRDGALAAVNLGGQSDVVGAVYGQLAGAHYGVNAIPVNWRNALLKRDVIESLADRLLADALVALGSGSASA